MVHQIYNKNRQDYTPVGQTWYRVRQEIKEMERTLAEFIAYLHTTKNTSNNTEISYLRDLKKLIRYLDGQNIHDFAEVTRFPGILRPSVHFFSIFSRKAGLQQIRPKN